MMFVIKLMESQTCLFTRDWNRVILTFFLQATFSMYRKYASNIWCHFVSNLQRYDTISAHVPKRVLQCALEKLQYTGMVFIHWTEVISSHHTIFAPVQKVTIALTKFKFYKKIQGFVKTLQIMSFQNDWQTLHRRGPSKGTVISKSHTF